MTQNLDSQELDDQTKSKDSKLYYGVMSSILIGCLLIGASIIVGAHYIVKNTGTASDTENKKYDIKIPNNSPYLGKSDAKVTMIEYGDFQCPYCAKFFSEVLPQLKSKYIDTGKVKFYFQNFAFLGNESIRAAEAASCAQDQGKFWDYYNKLYSEQKGEEMGAFSDPNLIKFAQDLKLDAQLFEQCFNSRTKKAEVEQETNTAEQNYSVNSTPTLFINGKKINGSGSVSAYETAIEAALK